VGVGDRSPAGRHHVRPVINQHDLDTQILLAMLPFVTFKRLGGVYHGPMHQPIEGALPHFRSLTGSPFLQYAIREDPEDEGAFFMHLTQVGETPLLDALPRRDVTCDLALPDEIFHPDDWFADFYRTTEGARRHYAFYTQIVEELKPRSILEIGVRAGYSAYAMLRAAPDAHYVGYDLNEGTFGGEVGYLDHARTMLRENFPRANVSVMIGDSQKSASMSRRYDLIHVDGAHLHYEVIHDLELCAPYADHVLVDDVGFISTVSSGVEEYLEKHPGLPGWFFPTWRGGGVALLDTRKV
jgi:hypothetical protein